MQFRVDNEKALPKRQPNPATVHFHFTQRLPPPSSYKYCVLRLLPTPPSFLLPFCNHLPQFFVEFTRFASMAFCHSDLVSSDQYVLCKAALIFGVTRWIFFWAHKLVKHYMCLFCLLSFENESQAQTSASASSLAIARENLSLTMFGDFAEERENCHDMSCVVCLMSFSKRDQVWKLSNCSHVFHNQCLDQWLYYDARMTCPLCRTSLITTTTEPPSQQPSWAVERILYLFGDDLLYSSPYSS